MWLIPLIVIGICLLGSLVAYLYTFFNFRKKERIHKLPKGEDYARDSQRMHRLIDQMAAIPPTREIEITSYDGTRLWGRYYHIADGAPLHIQMHGYHGNGIRDFCGGNKLARELGHNTLIVDQRAHGNSGGRTICFGLKERYDCKAWVEYAANTFGKDTPIFLSGVSMGASTVLLCAALPMQANVVGVIADCPYDSPKDIILKVAKDMHLPAKVLYPFVWLGALLYGRLLLKGSVGKAVAQAKIPMCIIHGEADKFVPVDMSRHLADQNPALCQLHTFLDAGHGLSYIRDFARYRSISHNFIRQCLQKHQSKAQI